MATFRKRHSRKYRNKNTRRTKNRRNARKSHIKRRGRKSLRGGVRVFNFFAKSSRVAQSPPPSDTPPSDTSPTVPALSPVIDSAPTSASSLPLKNVPLDKDINNFISKITEKMLGLTLINTTQDTQPLQMYIDAIKTTSQELAADYDKLLIQINLSEPRETIYENNKPLHEQHIEALVLIYKSRDKMSENILKDIANNTALTYYSGLLTVITKEKTKLLIN